MQIWTKKRITFPFCNANWFPLCPFEPNSVLFQPKEFSVCALRTAFWHICTQRILKQILLGLSWPKPVFRHGAASRFCFLWELSLILLFSHWAFPLSMSITFALAHQYMSHLVQTSKTWLNEAGITTQQSGLEKNGTKTQFWTRRVPINRTPLVQNNNTAIL